MDKSLAKESIKNGIIAVVRVQDYSLAKKISEVLISEGFNGIELTFSIHNCPLLIKELKDKYKDKVIGAGTVLSYENCKAAINSGADFIVSPCIVEAVAECSNENNVLCMLGASTPKEVFEAYNLGCEVVKLFPGDILGPRFIKDIKGPMPFINLMPSGGVSLENMEEWFIAGAYAVSAGGAVYSEITHENIEILKKRASQYVNEIKRIKGMI